jgi:DNA primase catalytic subunit
MANQKLNYSWRESNKKEIIGYYQNEFLSYIEEMPDHISPQRPEEFAISFGEGNYYPARDEDREKRQFIRRKSHYSGTAIFEDFEDLAKLFAWPARMDPLRGYVDSGYLADPDTVDTPEPVSRAVYYHVKDIDDNWPLVFDIDAKDIAARVASQHLDIDQEVKKDALYKQAGIRDKPPEGYNYTFDHIEQAIQLGFQLEALLHETFNYDDTMVVYSGQGCHIYGFDNDVLHNYDQQSRKVITYHLTEQLDFPLDTVVTTDTNRVIRLPYSLHSGVSRVVTPITNPDFDPRTQAIPQFLQ